MGAGVGVVDGREVGTRVGVPLGAPVGGSDGAADGVLDGDPVVGSGVGWLLGAEDG